MAKKTKLLLSLGWVLRAWRFPTFSWQTATLSSALNGFTSEFGMESGGLRPLLLLELAPRTDFDRTNQAAIGDEFWHFRKPECSGIKVADLDKVDWNQVNLDEWLGLLALTHHLPTDQNAASLLNLDQLTGSGSRLNPAKYGAAASNRQDTLTRTKSRMSGLDAPKVKRQAILEGWSMGP